MADRTDSSRMNQTDCHPEGDTPIPCYSLVAYIPDPLAHFLDELRRELAPGCKPRAHVTILPPRTLHVQPDHAAEQVSKTAMGMLPFEIETGDVEVFQVTDVVYLGIRRGWRELAELHRLLNKGPLEFQEPFEYHPHITLAQDLAPGTASEAAGLAAKRWKSFGDHRRFPVNLLCFVQGTAQKNWIDLSSHPLGTAHAKLR